jgi:hypothetical protein
MQFEIEEIMELFAIAARGSKVHGGTGEELNIPKACES